MNSQPLGVDDQVVRSLSFPLTVDDLPNLRIQISARSPQTDVVVHSSRMS
ncbi:unnamed protein product [Ectocarpus sp. CCAP 1310/34]|nr:unnamed protein product [Ectocarpus sp. CCAP 1310/34]CAB1106234.1 unnamed protein product [Ectocarpus sp. CCAP 1310/34]